MSVGWVLIITAVWWGLCIGAYFAWARRHLARSSRSRKPGVAP